MKHSYDRLALALILAAIIAVGFGYGIRYATGHEAPSGWTYPLECCGNGDCNVVPDADVRPGPEGWIVEVKPGEHPLVSPRQQQAVRHVIPYGDGRIKESPDGRAHVCLSAGGRTVYCVYVAPRGV